MKFELPSGIRLSKGNNHFLVIINNRNPFWIGFSIIIVSLGIWISFASLIIGVFVLLLGIMRLLAELVKVITVKVFDSGF